MSSTSKGGRSASEINIQRGSFYRISGKVRRASVRFLVLSRSKLLLRSPLPSSNVITGGEEPAFCVAPLSASAQPPSNLSTQQRDDQPLSRTEIHDRTASLLKQRLDPKEWERLKWDDYAGTTTEQTRAVIDEVKHSMDGKREHSEKMYKILQYVNKYCTIVDIAIQHQPQITALVWAGVRTIIQLAWNRYETLDSLEQAIQAIATTLNLDYKATFSVFEDQLLQLYAVVIELSLKAKNHLDPSGIAIAWKSSLKPFSTKFKPLLDEITEHEGTIRELANSAAMVEVLGKELKPPEGVEKWHGGVWEGVGGKD
ncbi:hypothetical protein BDD12DRAFT_880424 [Trichophaea hybrida]|nr:hypothetical protein BDD12DRAFT_880424 [Trichophaea hybrida]